MTDKKKRHKVIISTSRVNYYGTRVLTSGIDYSQYMRNPILLWLHYRGSVDSIVGTVEDIVVEGDNLIGYLVFDRIGETSKMVADKWEAGTIKMVSPNIEVLTLSELPEHLLPGQTRPTVTESKLIEISVVDIGGNDDALALQYQGKTIALSADDKNGKQLPLLATNKNDDMSFKKIALKLGLPETATHEEVIEAISSLDGLKAKNEKLEGELKKLKLSSITAMVDKAVHTDKKIPADKTAHFIELGEKIGAESLKLTLDSMSAQVKPIDITGQGAGQPSANQSGYKKLSEVPENEVLELRKNDKAEYMRLYRAEYGFECKI